MRKGWILAVLWALVCLIGVGQGEGAVPYGWGEPAATARPASFFFRGGIQWDMSREEVSELEAMELIGRDNGDWSILIPQKPVTVSRFTADLVYMFLKDRLQMIEYDFATGGSASDFAYLTGALDSVYGEHEEPEAAEIVSLMDRIYPTYYREGSITYRRKWTAGDGTSIYQFYYTPTAYQILYARPQEGAGSGAYDTTGL